MSSVMAPCPAPLQYRRPQISESMMGTSSFCRVWGWGRGTGGREQSIRLGKPSLHCPHGPSVPLGGHSQRLTVNSVRFSQTPIENPNSQTPPLDLLNPNRSVYPETQNFWRLEMPTNGENHGSQLKHCLVQRGDGTREVVNTIAPC